MRWTVGIASRLAGVLLAATVVGACGKDAGRTDNSARESVADLTSPSAVSAALHYVAFGDSWPEGAHCGRCRTFADLWATRIRSATGKEIDFTDYTGSRERSAARVKASASLLEALRTDDVTRAAVQSAEVLLIATGPNELEQILDPLHNGRCGGSDGFDCIRDLGSVWRKNFDAILTEIDKLRAGLPTAVRIVSAANLFVSDPAIGQGLPKDFATTGGALLYKLLTEAVCEAAVKHHAVCIDVRPILNGPTLVHPVDENSPASMQAVADALAAAGLPELGIQKLPKSGVHALRAPRDDLVLSCVSWPCRLTSRRESS